ncbi:MAG TPA: BLUF domain-containing protein [Polyangiaceae bacterium]
MEKVRQLAYISAARRPFSLAALTSLLLLGRERNHAQGLTGVLLYAEGSFLQVLEGSAAAVRSTFARIEADPRHHRIFRVFDGDVPVRSFADWSMGFVDGRDPRLVRLAGFNDVLQKGWSHSSPALSSQAQSLVHQFRDGRWRQADLPIAV